MSAELSELSTPPLPHKKYSSFEEVAQRVYELSIKVDDMEKESHRLNARFDRVLDRAELLFDRIEKEGLAKIVREILSPRRRR